MKNDKPSRGVALLRPRETAVRGPGQAASRRRAFRRRRRLWRARSWATEARVCCLQHQVNRNARHVDEQRDGSGRCDELPLVYIESQHGGRANAALVPDQPTEKSRERSAQPCERTVKTPSLRIARHLRRARHHKQRSEDDLERATCRPRVQQGALNPPAALVKPKLRTIVQSTSRRNRQKRIDVPMACGIETAATASFAPARTARRA